MTPQEAKQRAAQYAYIVLDRHSQDTLTDEEHRYFGESPKMVAGAWDNLLSDLEQTGWPEKRYKK